MNTPKPASTSGKQTDADLRGDCNSQSDECDVYIAGTASVFPAPLSARHVANKFYPVHLCSERTNALAQRVTANFGIEERPVCIDLERIPERVLVNESHHPLSWCVSLIQTLLKIVPASEVGYVGVAYNTSLHTNNLPNLACQAAIRSGIAPAIAPEEFANYGCAGGFYPLESAIQYCKRNDKAAVALVFDQCTSRASFCYDPNHAMFKMDLKINLLFSDGAAAVLVIPQRMRAAVSGVLPKVKDLSMAFSLSDMIRFEDTRFVLGDQVREKVPQLVADSVIKPLLSKNGIRAEEVAEWSIHQGSKDILGRFSEQSILGLSERQLARSRLLFERLGNMSAASCFQVLHSFCSEPNTEKRGTLGMAVGFGAGFYKASVLYQWE